MHRKNCASGKILIDFYGLKLPAAVAGFGWTLIEGSWSTLVFRSIRVLCTWWWGRFRGFRRKSQEINERLNRQGAKDAKVFLPVPGAGRKWIAGFGTDKGTLQIGIDLRTDSITFYLSCRSCLSLILIFWQD